MMPLADILFLAIVLYLLYRFIFHFLVPVARATRQVREQFRNMQDPNGGTQSQQRTYTTTFQQPDAPRPGQRPGPSGKAPASDYIDFEEIK